MTHTAVFYRYIYILDCLWNLGETYPQTEGGGLHDLHLTSPPLQRAFSDFAIPACTPSSSHLPIGGLATIHLLVIYEAIHKCQVPLQLQPQQMIACCALSCCCSLPCDQASALRKCANHVTTTEQRCNFGSSCTELAHGTLLRLVVPH